MNVREDIENKMKLSMKQQKENFGKKPVLKKYNLKPVCVYSVKNESTETYGMLYFADILEFEELPPREIERIKLFDKLPAEWTYPLIQPLLIEKVIELHFIK